MEKRYSKLHSYRRVSLWSLLLIAMYSIYFFSISNQISSLDQYIYDQAIQIVIESDKASISYLQRRLKIGYNRAARIIEKMEENNIVSKPGRAGKRDVLIEDI